MKDTWEKIIAETKKISIPAAALLQNGVLGNIDNINKTVTITFDNQGYIELLKRNKYLKVEDALLIVLGEPYKLIMEKSKDDL